MPAEITHDRLDLAALALRAPARAATSHRQEWLLAVMIALVCPATLVVAALQGHPLGEMARPIVTLALAIAVPVGVIILALVGPFVWVRAAVRRADYDRALARARFVARLPRYETIGHLLTGMVQVYRGDWAAADTALRRCLERLTGDRLGSTPWEYLGIALAARGRDAEAVDAFERAVAADPLNAGAFNALAEYYLQRGGPADRALRLAERAVALKAMRRADGHQHSEALANRAWALQMLGREAEASADLAAALAARVNFIPARAAIRYRAGRVRALQGDSDAAAALFHDAMTIDARGAYGQAAARALEGERT